MEHGFPDPGQIERRAMDFGAVTIREFMPSDNPL